MDDLENENEKKVDAGFKSSHFNFKLLWDSGPLHMKSKNNMANVFEDANEKNDENIKKPLLKKTNLVHKRGRVSKRNVREWKNLNY